MTTVSEARQFEALKFIVEHLRVTGYPPTVREIGEAVGLSSPSSSMFVVAALEEDGYIARDQTRARAIRVTDKGKEAAT